MAAVPIESKLTVGDFSGSAAAVHEALVKGGLEPGAAKQKAALFAEAAAILEKSGIEATATARGFFVPGRVEVLGKHTDYAGGRSHLMAVSKAFCVVTVDRDDDQCRFFSTHADDQVTLKPSDGIEPIVGHWTNYPATAVKRLTTNFPGDFLGVDVSFACDIPVASGLSTSSAIICAVWLALNARNNYSSHPAFKENIMNSADLVEFLGCNENGQSFKGLVGDKGVGTFGGSEDHTAIMTCQKGSISTYSFCPTVEEAVFPWGDDMAFVIAVSGSIAEKTGDKMQDYNDAALLAKEAARVYFAGVKRELPRPHLANAVRDAKGDPDAVRKIIKGHFAAGGTAAFDEAALIRRFDQFFAESEEIIPAFADAHARGDWAALGALVDRSQELTDTHLQNQVPETVFLAKSAREAGAVAASAFGAGFGGSVWACVVTAKTDAFVAEWKAHYTKAYPAQSAQADFFVEKPGPGAFEL
mmetsp:Transcript_36304/g.108932  ORF Transcript_36304/g.108932 Transcript_36304/m.108932 type:complete len:472 (-) Transcript_36304:96-1511(-)